MGLKCEQRKVACIAPRCEFEIKEEKVDSAGTEIEEFGLWVGELVGLMFELEVGVVTSRRVVLLIGWIN